MGGGLPGQGWPRPDGRCLRCRAKGQIELFQRQVFVQAPSAFITSCWNEAMV
jgi:hypothetical protein